MSETLLAILIPAIVGTVTGIIGALIGYRKITNEAKGIAAEAELDKASAAQIIKDASVELIEPLVRRIKSQDERILSMTGTLDRLKNRVEHLETVVAVQGELLFILRSGADKLVGQLLDLREQPVFTLEHDKVVELEAVLSEAVDGYSSGGGNVQ